MTDKTPQNSGAARPTGKRQLSGKSTVSSSSYEAKRVEARRAEGNGDTPGGGPFAFLPEVVQEVRKVIWPTGREMAVYTTVVFGFLIILTGLVWGVDQLAAMGVEAVFVR